MKRFKFDKIEKTGKRKGFTLLEIIVVLAILGLGLATISTLTTATSRQSRRVEEDTTVQLACQNMMNSILSGEKTVLVGVELPIADAPDWTTTVELLDGPLESLVAIRITARRFETIETPSPTDPYSTVLSRVPDATRRFVLKEWARRADVKTRTLQTNLDGTVSAADSSAADSSAAFSGAFPAAAASNANAEMPFGTAADEFGLGLGGGDFGANSLGGNGDFGPSLDVGGGLRGGVGVGSVSGPGFVAPSTSPFSAIGAANGIGPSF